MSTLTPERTARLRALAETLRDDYELTGRWGWYGHVNGGGTPHLATQQHGRLYLMTFVRLGMNGAQPTFPVREGELHGMRRASEIPIFEVCPEATSRTDPRVYRDDIIGFRSPVADYLAEVDADTVLALLDEIARLRAKLAGEELCTCCGEPIDPSGGGAKGGDEHWCGDCVAVGEPDPEAVPF